MNKNLFAALYPVLPAVFRNGVIVNRLARRCFFCVGFFLYRVMRDCLGIFHTLGKVFPVKAL